MEAGMGSMPGGGAEIFHPEVRGKICEHKADATKWLDIHRTAHELGLRTNCTMLYGHVENAYHRVDHLLRLRELQDETGGFQTFIPLAFHPTNTGLSQVKKASSLVDLRTMAVSRLMLDNIPHIKAYWISLGVGTAQVALSYGADDIDGTVRHELIYHDAGSTVPEVLSVERIRYLIQETGREAIERDTLYRRVIRDADNPVKWTIGGPVGGSSE
jgi:aminodeoxyfutalosine synthase